MTAPTDSRWLWIEGGLLGLLLTATACGTSSTASSAGPPTATAVANAIKNSSMKNAHFTVQGKAVPQRPRQPDGSLSGRDRYDTQQVSPLVR